MELIAAHCRRANREGLTYTAALVRRDPAPNRPQRKAALADLDAAMSYREAAETEPAIVASNHPLEPPGKVKGKVKERAKSEGKFC
ncbi:hypothetical protein AB0O77_24255 [Streptomyces albidoflavus]|uniref:hypothetical protein n=1 Tax=Streptomyces albidoflavus TaxID=1886 RepID=UPI003419E7BF